MKRKFLLSLIFIQCFALHAFPQNHVTLVEDSVFSSSVSAYMRFYAVLPIDYYTDHNNYVTVYLFHGYDGDYTNWVTRTDLLNYAKDYPFVLITPDGKNSWYTNSSVAGKAGNYEDYIINDLIPYVDKNYRTLNERNGRAIAGLSMGGYGAMKFALKYPSKFFYAASFSGALYVPTTMRADGSAISKSQHTTFGQEKSEHWTKNDTHFLIDSVSIASLPYLYISAGKDDHVRFVESNREFAEKLRSKGAAYEYHEKPGAHTWQFWNQEVEIILEKILAFVQLEQH
jgi:S-formylglutathione hydrolase FrmB